MFLSRHNAIKMEVPPKKSLKITTHEQFDVLTRELKQCPEMAKNGPSYPADRVQLLEKWGCLTRKLNAIGPPRRSIAEWKKVWSDLKCRAKKKIFENGANDALFKDADGSGTAAATSLEQSNEHIQRILTSKEALALAIERERTQCKRDSPRHSNMPAFVKVEPAEPDEADGSTPAPDEADGSTPAPDEADGSTPAPIHPLTTTSSSSSSPEHSSAELAYKSRQCTKALKRLLDDKAKTLQQGMESETKLLEVLKTMMKSIESLFQRQAVKVDRQTVAVERHAAAAERCASAAEAILALLNEKPHLITESPSNRKRPRK